MIGIVPSSFEPLRTHGTYPASIVRGICELDPLVYPAALAALPSLCAGCTGPGAQRSRPPDAGPAAAGQAAAGQASAPPRCVLTPDCPWHGGLHLIGVHGIAAVARCPLRRGAAERHDGVPTLVYTVRDRLAAALHVLHGCSDAAAVLLPHDGGSRFEIVDEDPRLRGAGLTPREADVLALLLARVTNEEIAAALTLSQATVRAHCRAVLRKLGASRRRDLWRQFDEVSPLAPISTGHDNRGRR
jgi:DNA-binding CsgD family transcriptional regulator